MWKMNTINIKASRFLLFPSGCAALVTVKGWDGEPDSQHRPIGLALSAKQLKAPFSLGDG